MRVKKVTLKWVTVEAFLKSWWWCVGGEMSQGSAQWELSKLSTHFSSRSRSFTKRSRVCDPFSGPIATINHFTRSKIIYYFSLVQLHTSESRGENSSLHECPMLSHLAIHLFKQSVESDGKANEKLQWLFNNTLNVILMKINGFRNATLNENGCERIVEKFESNCERYAYSFKCSLLLLEIIYQKNQDSNWEEK